jgi:sortase family protein
MPAVPRPPEEQALPEERRPAGKWWLAEKQEPAEQRGSAEASRTSAEKPRRSAETQPLAVMRGPDEEWWLAEKQRRAEQRRSAETQSLAATPAPAATHGPAAKSGPAEKPGLDEKQGLDEKWWLAANKGPAGNQGPAGKPGLAGRWDSAETQPLPVIRGPIENRGNTRTHEAAGTQGSVGAQGSTGVQGASGTDGFAGALGPGGTGKRPEGRRLPEDWWDPGWQAAQSPGVAPLQREILKPASGTGTGAAGETTGPAGEIADETSPSWGRVAGATSGLRTGRHLRWLRGAPGQGRGRLAAASALAAGLVAIGIGAGGLVTANVSATPTVEVARPTPIAAPTEQTEAPPTTAVSAAPVGKAQAVAKPVWVSIPTIGIKKTKLIRLGLTSQGTLQVPKTTTVAGWFTGGPRPGAVGSAVIAGHVDSKTGPGIFFWLRALKPGDKVYVGRADGTMAVFTVTREHMYAKDRFPTKAVYGAVPDAELRLITCGGIFDRSTGSYLSNVVVFARLST